MEYSRTSYSIWNTVSVSSTELNTMNLLHRRKKTHTNPVGLVYSQIHNDQNNKINVPFSLKWLSFCLPRNKLYDKIPCNREHWNWCLMKGPTFEWIYGNCNYYDFNCLEWWVTHNTIEQSLSYRYWISLKL